jgi:hypothetical protein
MTLGGDNDDVDDERRARYCRPRIHRARTRSPTSAVAASTATSPVAFRSDCSSSSRAIVVEATLVERGGMMVGTWGAAFFHRLCDRMTCIDDNVESLWNLHMLKFLSSFKREKDMCVDDVNYGLECIVDRGEARRPRSRTVEVVRHRIRLFDCPHRRDRTNTHAFHSAWRTLVSCLTAGLRSKSVLSSPESSSLEESTLLAFASRSFGPLVHLVRPWCPFLSVQHFQTLYSLATSCSPYSI